MDYCHRLIQQKFINFLISPFYLPHAVSTATHANFIVIKPPITCYFMAKFTFIFFLFIKICFIYIFVKNWFIRLFFKFYLYVRLQIDIVINNVSIFLNPPQYAFGALF